MSLAQQLYEAGHITYMRTDGVSMAPTAVADLFKCIGKEFGAECLPDKPRVYKTRSKNAQASALASASGCCPGGGHGFKAQRGSQCCT